MSKIAIPVNNVKGKQMSTDQDGHGECPLEGSSEAGSWIVQVQQRYVCGEYKKRETSPSVCIYRVPESIRKNEPKDYDPLVVSLGPYHHKQHLSPMDDHKLQAVEATLQRLHPMTMDDLIREVARLEGKIRDCYEDSVMEWDGNTLVWMLTMDACFILEFLRERLSNSSLVFNNIKRGEILLDILKLENQIPIFVLEKILELEFKGSEHVTVVLAKILTEHRYFRGYPFSQTSANKKEVQVKETVKLITESPPRHLLDLCGAVISDFLTDSTAHSDSGFYACIYSFRRPRWTDILRCLFRSTRTDQGTMPSAEKLQRAGIKCEPSPSGKVHFKHKSFGRSTLFLPQITVENSTEILLRNLMAFEECQRGLPPRVTTRISPHMCLMDELIDSKEDVGLFEKEDIIRNYLGSDEELATVFNDLCHGITYGYGDAQLKKVVRMVNEHYNSQLNVWMSQFIEERFSKPWYIVSFVVAVILLVMTAVQTFYSVIR